MDNVEVEDREFSSIVDTLVNMFGNILNKDVITAVVENCAGDLNLSAEAIMNITDGQNADITEPDLVPPFQSSGHEMDLISFNTHDNLRISNNTQSVPGSNSAISPEAGTSTSIVTLTPIISANANSNCNSEVKSNLNAEAHAYVPGKFSSGIDGNMRSTTDMNSDVTPDQNPFAFQSTASITPHKDGDKTQGAENNFQSLISYSNVSRKTGALPKKPQKSDKRGNENNFPPHVRGVIEYISQGFRILILLRGVPGSGKSYLAKQIIQATVGDRRDHFDDHILSTDDFFSVRGAYEFNKFYLRDAHAWNHKRAKVAMERGLSPVIIDNTNVEVWEMEPYVRFAVLNGYKIEVIEPKTPWARKPNQLMRKNIHGVTITSIVRMLESFAENVTGEYLINCFKLCYHPSLSPPVLRNSPPIQSSIKNHSGQKQNKENKKKSPKRESHQNNETLNNQSLIVTPVEKEQLNEENNESIVESNECAIPNDLQTPALSVNSESISANSVAEDDANEDSQKQDCYKEIQKQLEELEHLEREWENNEGWEDDGQNNADKNKSNSNTEPKPQRDGVPIRSEIDDKLLNAVTDCQDWTKISMFMPPWNDESRSVIMESVIPTEMISSGTSVEIGDTDIYEGKIIYKVITAVPRDINEHYITPSREKIPEKRMLDKSSMTNDRSMTENFRCKNEERHFTAFRKMFKMIPKSDLRDIFDNCHGDVNWAVEIVLDGICNNQLQFMEKLELSDVEDENTEQCTCLAAYNIVPDTGEQREENSVNDDIPDIPTDNIPQRKPKKDMPISDISIQLKRQIEQNVVISDNHYSLHCLKIRKLRRGEGNAKITELETDNPDEADNAQALVPLDQVSDSQDKDFYIADNSDDESNASVEVEELEKIVNVHVGREFIQSIDELFGRRGITYPENVEPRLSIPLTLVNELNALWMESLMHQLDEYEKQSVAMVQQDEEFARQLAMKEMELAQAGKEPEVPDFKEIMDMDFAMSIYQKDIAEWRSKEPTNLAAKMTRDKLYNLFPDVPQDTLSELLVAHDNNFKSTVEVLLMSTGKAEILEQKNGLVKFVMAKEFKRQEEIMEEQKKALSEVEWPLLPKGEAADMSVVTKYRDAAAEHLVRRNLCHNKAQDYFRRGMTTVATYYTDVANFHKNMFDQANSLAAASLIQVHALKAPDNATIDLHYLRVAEAKESMDLFIDSHINKLRELRSQNRGPRQHTLFFITGRGLHSQGGPKVKPAVKKRLRERGIACRERNPGLLCARITADDKLTYQVQI